MRVTFVKKKFFPQLFLKYNLHYFAHINILFIDEKSPPYTELGTICIYFKRKLRCLCVIASSFSIFILHSNIQQIRSLNQPCPVKTQMLPNGGKLR